MVLPNDPLYLSCFQEDESHVNHIERFWHLLKYSVKREDGCGQIFASSYHQKPTLVVDLGDDVAMGLPTHPPDVGPLWCKCGYDSRDVERCWAYGIGTLFTGLGNPWNLGSMADWLNLEQLGDVCYVHEIGDMVPKQSAVHVGKWGFP